VLDKVPGGEYVFAGGLTLEQVLAHRDELPIMQGLPDRAYRPADACVALLVEGAEQASLDRVHGRGRADRNAPEGLG
jgi:hypothetical protein